MKIRKLATVALCAVIAVAFTFGAVLPASASQDSVTGTVPKVSMNTGSKTVQSISDGTPDQYVTAGKTIRNIKTARMYQINNSSGSKKTTTIIYKSPVNGGITLSAANSRSSNVVIYMCNSKGKRISGKFGVNALSSSTYLNTLTFGAKKGQTYEIKVEDSSSVVALAFHAYNYTASYGTSYRKMSKLKNNEKRKGFIAAGTSAAKYYKYTVKGRQVRVIFTGDVDSLLYAKVTVSAPGYKTTTKYIKLNRTAGHKMYFSVGSTRNITVQVKVYRSGTSSGIYYVMCSKMK
ncbi:MAG: hypothetical protein ACOYJH_03205 [Anaerovoracaceae bacterium]|jgi:hypothetical protein